MEPKQPLENFCRAIRDRLPPGVNVAAALSDILCVSKDSVYRRLRGEVPFSLRDIAAISRKLDISVDRVIGVNRPDVSPFFLHRMPFGGLDERDYALLENSINDIRKLSRSPRSEFGSVSNMVSQTFLCRYEGLYRFHVLKRLHQYGSPEILRPYRDIRVPERLQRLQREYAGRMMEIGRTFFVWDPMIFCRLADDIRRFSAEELVRADEVRSLKHELGLLLRELEETAAAGRFPNGRPVEFYVADTHFETTYIYIETPEACASLVRVFTLNTMSSTDLPVFRIFREWIQGVRERSVPITASDGSRRDAFFGRQRAVIGEL